MVWNYQNADCSLKNKFPVSFTVISCTLWLPVLKQVQLPTNADNVALPTFARRIGLLLSTSRAATDQYFLPAGSFSALTLLVSRQEGHPACKKTERWGAGVVICLERCADLNTAQLMPLPLTVSCFSKIQFGFTFLVPAHAGSPGQRAVKWVCVWGGSMVCCCGPMLGQTDRHCTITQTLLHKLCRQCRQAFGINGTGNTCFDRTHG